jgi:autoinducer 2-degrading protein
MFVVAVTVSVKPEFVDRFKAAILDNARNTRKELGNVRFDVSQDEEDPTRFLLYEVYHGPADFADHQATSHFIRWRDTVADWMAQPRQRVKLRTLFFGDGESGR